MSDQDPRHAVVVTGATGVAYGLRLIDALARTGAVDALFSAEGATTAQRELGLALGRHDATATLLAFLGLRPDADVRVELAGTASPGTLSGYASVVVAPASASFLGALANGLADEPALALTAAALARRGRVVLVPTESPVGVLGLRNLVTLAEAGAVVVPASPGYERRPASVDDLVNDVVGRIMELIGVGHDAGEGWR